jgi:hypothetical protein
MRLMVYVRVFVVLVSVSVAVSGSARERDVPREKEGPVVRVVKVVKKAVRSLGDMLVVPRP